jgi:hypothetical protein
MPHAAPTAVNRTLPLRQPNAAYRQREYLTEAEVNRLIVESFWRRPPHGHRLDVLGAGEIKPRRHAGIAGMSGNAIWRGRDKGVETTS